MVFPAGTRPSSAHRDPRHLDDERAPTRLLQVPGSGDTGVLSRTEPYARELFGERSPTPGDEETEAGPTARRERRRLLTERPNTACRRPDFVAHVRAGGPEAAPDVSPRPG